MNLVSDIKRLSNKLQDKKLNKIKKPPEVEAFLKYKKICKYPTSTTMTIMLVKSTIKEKIELVQVKYDKKF